MVPLRSSWKNCAGNLCLDTTSSGQKRSIPFDLIRGIANPAKRAKLVNRGMQHIFFPILARSGPEKHAPVILMP